jgi:hypothetical protein
MLAISMSVVVAPPFFNFATPLLYDAKNLRHRSNQVRDREPVHAEARRAAEVVAGFLRDLRGSA